MQVIEIQTETRDQFLDITDRIQTALDELAIEKGALVVFVPHTTAGIAINEHADPTVAQDIQADLNRLVPWDQSYYQHREGNSPSHTRASLVGSSELVMVEAGELQLGTWQGIFFCEFDGPRRRKVFIQPVAS